MLSNPIDLRVWLDNRQFRQRVLESESWADYLTQPPIPPFDELSALAEVAQRNAARVEAKLTLLDARQELARLRQAYDSERFSERFYGVSFRCIWEIYGAIEPSDFNSMSAMHGFFAHRQNVIRGLIQKQSASGRRR
jgi:hypothetical protein